MPYLEVSKSVYLSSEMIEIGMLSKYGLKEENKMREKRSTIEKHK